MSDESRRVRCRGARRWFLVLSGTGLVLVLLMSCTHLGYYSQSVWGGAGILTKRQPVAALIEDQQTPANLRERLALALEMREFAVSELGLADNASYRSYSELDRPYVLWNVVASPELSIVPKTWCFLVVGCVAYRGYFSEQRAHAFADRLRREGYDVDVGGVAAYSTIGWFADPLLSTFINQPEPQLAGMLFHELAHQRAFVKGDTTFNESFAMAVEQEGAMRWLAHRGRPEQIEAYRLTKERQRQFSELVLAHRERLAEAFAAEESDEWKRRRKADVLADLETEYEALKLRWDGYAGFDGWFERGLNNARLALVGAYHQLLPAFLSLLRTHDGQFEPFYAEVDEIAALDFDTRRRRLGDSAEPHSEDGTR